MCFARLQHVGRVVGGAQGVRRGGKVSPGAEANIGYKNDEDMFDDNAATTKQQR